MNYLKMFEEFDRDGYQSHWIKFNKWLNDKDFELYDDVEDLMNKFLEVANNDEFSSEEKAESIASYLDDKWGLYGGYSEVTEYLDKLFMDDI